MFSAPAIVRRHRAILLASSFIIHTVFLTDTEARAQQAGPDQLPPIEVTKPRDQNRTRARATGDSDTSQRRAAPTVAPRNAPAGAGAGSSSSGNVTVASSGGIVGAATTVITAADIERLIGGPL